MSRIFTSEFVSKGHPDKVADQISDRILDIYLEKDVDARVAVETLVTTDNVIVAGEVNSKYHPTKEEIDSEIRDVINTIGYNDDKFGFNGHTCRIQQLIHKQSPDIAQGVDESENKEQGAGDQGMMFGYACNETDNYMPLTLELAKNLIWTYTGLVGIKSKGTPSWCRPDAKSQVTIEYDDYWNPIHINTIVMSVQHEDDVTIEQVRKDIRQYVIDPVMDYHHDIFDENTKIYINPTGRFVIGGPAGDTGVTGRKIVVDNYGGRCPVGGGAYSGKDPSKVDRSAAYACRHIAKNLVAANISSEILVQVSYAIGRPEPLNIYVDTYDRDFGYTNEQIVDCIKAIYDFRPASIIKNLNLKRPIYYGASMSEIGFLDHQQDYTWEKLDLVETIKKYFSENV